MVWFTLVTILSVVTVAALEFDGLVADCCHDKRKKASDH